MAPDLGIAEENRVAPTMKRIEQAFETERKHKARWVTLVVVMAAFGLFYMAGSVAVMYHLTQENNESCQSRAAARSVIRDYIAQLPDWDAADQTTLDLRLPPLTC